MKILIMGLPGSGKTALAKALQKKLKCLWFNADTVREQFNDWDFSHNGRIRQSERMRDLANSSSNESKYVIVDFIAPFQETRDIFDADFTVWVNRIETSIYQNTNNLFEKPIKCDVEILPGFTVKEEVALVCQKLNDTFKDL